MVASLFTKLFVLRDSSPSQTRTPSRRVVALLLGGSAWSIAGNLVTQGASIAATLAIARMTSKLHFGLYATILSTVIVVATFSGLGLGVTLTRNVAALRYEAPQLLARYIRTAYRLAFLGAVCGALIITAAISLWSGSLNLIDGPILASSAVQVMALCLFTLQMAELAGYAAFRQQAFALILRGAILLPMAMLGTHLGGIAGALSAGNLAIIGAIAMQAHALRRLRPARSRGPYPSIDVSRGLLGESLPILVGQLANAGSIWLATILVAAIGAAGLSAVAEFSAAAQIRNVMLFLPVIVGQVALPLMADRRATAGDSRALIRFTIATNVGIAALFGLASVVGRQYITSAFGTDYSEMTSVVPVVCLAGVCHVAAGTLGYLVAGKGLVSLPAKATAVGGSVAVLAAWLLGRYNPSLGGNILGYSYLFGSVTTLAAYILGLSRHSTLSSLCGRTGMSVERL